VSAGLDPAVGFPLFLVVTVLLLGGVVLSGVRAKLHVHLPLVALAVVSLGVTIWFAEKLGELYDLDSAGAITPIHLAIAKTTTLAYLLPVASGIATLRNRRHRRLHFWLAMLVLALTLVTAATGAAMVLMSRPLAA
jgi:hypothetical protein